MSARQLNRWSRYRRTQARRRRPPAPMTDGVLQRPTAPRRRMLQRVTKPGFLFDRGRRSASVWATEGARTPSGHPPDTRGTLRTPAAPSGETANGQNSGRIRATFCGRPTAAGPLNPVYLRSAGRRRRQRHSTLCTAVLSRRRSGVQKNVAPPLWPLESPPAGRHLAVWSLMMHG